MKNASYCVSYGKEGRLQQNEQKNSFCYSPFLYYSSGWSSLWMAVLVGRVSVSSPSVV